MNQFLFRAVLSSLSLTLALSAPAFAQSYSPSPDLLGSPALLGNYVEWAKAQDGFSAPGSETLAFRNLIYAVYNTQVGYDANEMASLDAQLKQLRSQVCGPSAGFAFCQLPAKIADATDIAKLGESLLNENLAQALEKRWGMPVSLVQLPNTPNQSFNFEVGPQAASGQSTAQYWDMSPTQVRWFSITPVLSDIASYSAGVNDGSEVPAMFALSNSGIVVNDWQLRTRVMRFAHQWKDVMERNPPGTLPDPIVAPTEFQLTMLFNENQNLFDSTYLTLLSVVNGVSDVSARFISERSTGRYPEEVYQHVAYHLFVEMLSVQSSYYQLAQKQRTRTSDRQKALESLLTLQRYLKSPRLLLVELQTLSAPLMSHATLMDQTVNFDSAEAYSFEQLRVVLGLDNYANTNYFARFGYSLLNDGLFNPSYLKANAPNIYQELLQPDGTCKRIGDLPVADQIRLLNSYLRDDKGQVTLVALTRVMSAYLARIHAVDLRAIAEIIHQKEVGNFNAKMVGNRPANL